MATTVAELFYSAVKFNLPNALAYRESGVFRPISHAEFQARVERLALALEARGLRKGDRLAILSENRPEWAVADFACAVSGIVSVPIYATLNLNQTAYILRNSRARWVICSTRQQLDKILDLWPGLPHLEVAVLMAGQLPSQPPPGQGGPLIHWTVLQEEGALLEARRPELQARSKALSPSDLLTVIYTSGTTGDPKGAMLSHGNITSNVSACLKILRPLPGERVLSLLPLSHIFERTCGHFVMVHSGVSIYYAENLQTVARDLQEVRPHLLLGVPRIYEKIYSKVREQVHEGGPLKRLLFRWATQIGQRTVPYLYQDQRPGLPLRLMSGVFDALVYRRIRALFGGRLRLAAVGGAPIHPHLLEFFWAAGLPIFEGYGLTETSPVLTLCLQGQMRPGYVGRPILDTWEGKPFLVVAEDGEVLARGPNVMLGYWENEQATREVMDDEGYFHTGDIGEWDAQGRLKITDRKKEILVTSGGKNIAPQPMENALRADHFIEQAVIIGDRRNYITALLVPNFSELGRWANHKKLPFSSDADLATLPEAMDKLMRRVERVNAHLSNFERIRKIALIDHELTADSGLLTPSLKIRRKAINEAFADLIEKLYTE